MSDAPVTDRRRLLELMLQRRGLAAGTEASPEPAARERPDEIPMSYGQQRLWFLSELYPDSAVYNVTGAIRLRGELDVERLRGALQRIVDRHEALRTGFAGGSQVVAEDAALEVPLVRAADPWPALREHAARPFDLRRPPLLRCLLVQVSEREHLLGLSVHHIAADGWSLGVLTGELSDLYGGREPAPLPLQYPDYALWQREASLDDGVAWWRERMAGAPTVLDLPADRPPPPQASFAGANHLLELPDVTALARVQGATEFQVLLAGLAALLQRLTGEEDVVIGTPVAGRTRPELEPLIGFFVNTLPLRIDLTGDPSFAALLDRVRDTALSAADHQDVPFDRLVEELGGPREMSVPPVYQVLLAFQNAPSPALVLEGLEIEFVPLEPEGARLPLGIDVSGREATLTYSTARFDAETIEDLGRRWVRLLESALAQPGTPLSRLAIAGPDEPRAVLRGAAAPPAPPVPDAIAAQPPGAPAVEGMTFGELNARADARAAELGALHGRLVQVPAERGVHHVVEALAVWRAGGAITTASDCAPVGRDAAGLAYAVRTSGSTGRPKLVGVDHAALANACAWCARALELGPGDRASQTFSLAFDASMLDLWASLAAGAEVRFAPEDARLDGARLADWMAAEAITIGSAPPALVPALFARPKPPSLRGFSTGGDRIAADVPEGVRLCFGYGPTEAAIIATVAGDLGSIGTPIDGVCVYVLDGDLRPVPQGVIGELYLGGAGVGRGYLGMPGMTAERFLPDPLGAAGARMYRTGDLGRLRRDGRLEFRGRVDEQLKVRGHRIEPGEVETALRQHPDVTEAAVVSAGDRLVAAVVASAPAAALREHLAGRVPAYMVPQAFLHLDALPRTASGKVDRRRLAALEPRAVAVRGAERPRTATEQALAAIWAEVLGSNGFGPTDDFFAVGGHSLLATQVVARVRDRLGLELPLRVLFESPSLGAFAAAVEEAMRGSAVEAPPPPRPVRRTGPLPLSFSQQRLWFLDQMEPGSHVYNLPVAVRLRGPLDRDALERAVRGVVERHEALRTTFTTVADEPRQVIARDVPVPFSLVNLGEGSAAERERRLQQALAEDARRPFDLESGPLLRCTLLRLADDEHVLALCMHHVVSDGWSLGVLAGELSALYAGRPLPALPLQYADYAAWQREWLSGEVLEREIDHWRRTLAGAPAAIELPSDRPRTPVVTPEGQTHSWTVPRELAAQIDALAAAEGATSFMVLLAAWAALLSRMSGQDDVVVGTPIANRRHSETEGLIGFFANTLVLRTRVDGDPTFAELVGRAREAALDAYAHQDLPFEKLVDAVAPTRDLSLTPIFQVGFSVSSGADPQFRFGEVEATFEDVDAGVAKWDLSLDVYDGGDGQETTINYRTALFDPETIEALAERWEATLRAVVEAPGRRVSQLELLGAGERARLEALAGGSAPFDAHALVHEMFERHADAAPDAVALVFEGGSMTYGELEAAANRLANRLRAAGVRPEDRVGLLVERGFGLIVGVLGILKAGAAYVPVDPSHPDARIAFTFDDAGVRLAVCDQAERLPAGVDAVPPDAGEDASRPVRTASPRSAAYVIYTSGSTGTPKGVLVEHRSVMNLIEAQRGSFAPSPEDRVLQFPSIGFDAAVWDLVMALANGASLVLAPRASLLPGPDLLATMRDNRVTIATLQPTAVAALPEGELPDLRLLVIAGEALTGPLAQRWAKVTRTVNAYGPTEATVGCVWHDVAGEADGPPPIGRPIANAPARVLDAHGNPVPVGVAGELHVGGAAVARGYLGRPALTAERFVPDPWGEPGSRLYRTGDRARFTRAGELEFLGRVDRQVKLRGFRIEPGEIESAVQAHADVLDAVATVREDQPGDRRLVAYVVPRPGATPSVADLRAHLAGRLPEHMMPSAFVLLDQLPLTVNHKVDHDALPAPTAERPELEAAYAPARTEREEAVAAIWAGVLGLDRVGAFDNFFDLGGHSLLATQVVARVRDRLGLELPLRALFESPTLEAFAAAVDAASHASGVGVLPPPRPVARTGPLPLSFSQQRLWFLDQMEPGSHEYNLPVAVRLRGALDRHAIERAVRALVARHESLRTTFTTIDGEPRQVVAPDASVPFSVMELEDLPPAERERRLEQALAEEARRPFDLASGPLLRCTLIRLDEREHVLALCMHHVVSDGWSLGVLADELSALYAGRALPPLPLQYPDYAVWQREWLAGEVLEREIDHWKRTLAGAPAAIELPSDRPRPPVVMPAGRTHGWTVPPELAARIDALAAAEGATPFMVLLAAWSALLSRMTGQHDIVVGTPIANRRHSETEGLIGFFANTLVLRTDTGGNPSFRKLVSRAREASLDAYAHQDVPFEKLVDAVAPPRDLSLTPIFQVGFSVQNAADPQFRFGDAEAEFEDVDTGVAKWDLSLDVFDGEDGHGTSINYRTALFDPETIEALAERWEALLQAVVDAPDRPLSDLDVLGPGERERLLELAGTSAPYESGALVHEVFERHADAAPDAVALIFEGATMSYGELERAANRLANRLRARGVAPDDRVGLLVERGFGLIVGVLGILKAGAAYVPVDASYPDARIAFTFADAGVRLAVCDLPERLPEGVAAVPPAAGGDETRPARVAGSRSLAYVIYTSGSTGLPKGVLVEHRSVLNLIEAQRASFAPGPQDRVLQFPSIGFDAAVWDIVMALANGASLVLGTRPSMLPGRDLLATMTGNRVTIATLQPTAVAALPDAELPDLRLLVIAGEALTGSLARRWAKVTRTVNAYGPTEATVGCTWHDVSPDRAGLGSPPIGRPIANAPARVLDAHGNPVPVGVAGELHVGGVATARGYLGRPGLTAERFVPDPWGEPGSRLYRTGDRARFTRAGELEFLGRVDRQVKLRGFRVELGEIESAVQAHPDVADAAAIVREDQPGDRRLVAYVVPRPGATPSVADLRAHVADRLPDHMMPSAFVLLEHLPLTVNHKVDRDALPAPTAERPELGAAYTPPRDEREHTLAGIWADVLGLDRVGVLDNFFDLGGDSILAIQVVARANDAGIPIAAKHLFQAQTIAALGTLDSGRAVVEPDQGLIAGPVPLTPIQRWFLEQDQPDPDHFNQAVALAADAVDPELLRRTLGHLLWQHDALRLRVERGADGEFHQRITDSIDDVLEVCGGTTAEHAGRIQASLDLAAGPVFRAAWFPDDGRLLLVAHHICVDAVSWPILVEHLNDVYEQLAGGAEQPDLPPKSTSLRWWAERLAEHARTPVLQAELDRWLAAIPAQVAPLPRDGDGENTIGAARTVTSFVGADATQALTAHGVFDALVHALGAAVAEWAGDERGALLALEAHGREEIFDGASLFATVGWFTNVYPLWVPRAGGLEAAREARAAVPANGLGYGLLRHMTDAGKRLAALPQPEIALNYLGRVEGGFAGGARFEPASGDTGPAMSPRTRRPYPLDVTAQIMGSGLQLQWSFSPGLHDRETIVSLATRVTTLLEELAR